MGSSVLSYFPFNISDEMVRFLLRFAILFFVQILYPSIFRVVGSSNDFAPAVDALFRRHGWDRASILYVEGATRELSHSTEAWQV